MLGGTRLRKYFLLVSEPPSRLGNSLPRPLRARGRPARHARVREETDRDRLSVFANSCLQTFFSRQSVCVSPYPYLSVLIRTHPYYPASALAAPARVSINISSFLSHHSSFRAAAPLSSFIISRSGLSFLFHHSSFIPARVITHTRVGIIPHKFSAGRNVRSLSPPFRVVER